MFTRQERKALAFLLGAGLFGLGVMAWPHGRVREASTWATPLQVRVNRAEEAELVALPGIGPAMAKRIVEERRHGGFYFTLSDLKRVKGMTSKTLERLGGFVRFD